MYLHLFESLVSAWKTQSNEMGKASNQNANTCPNQIGRRGSLAHSFAGTAAPRSGGESFD
jgi:hypothetical protein